MARRLNSHTQVSPIPYRVLPAVDLCGWMMTNRRGARATGDGLPERTKLAAVLAAVKVRPGSVSGEGSVGRAGRP
jgi:hypothetical protein